MNFTKMQGAGNDFVVVAADAEPRDWSQLAMTICDRHFGVGADGLILALPSDKADVGMREFNSDGSEAEACGNGIRCLARFAVERGLVSPDTDRLSVETLAGIRELKLLKSKGRLADIQAGMGEPGFSADDIPVVLESGREKLVYIKSMASYPVTIDGTSLRLNFVSMGNPHAVYFSPRPVADFPLFRLGPEVEYLPIFPNRVNFEVARVISRHQVEVRVWERGVGETLACGSGACAVAVAAQLYEYIDNKVDINLPGGILQVAWNGTGEVLMNGPAETVFTGEWLE
ncbi:diaminopimelate epimerase [Chloroflexota bacterium]